MSWIEKILPPRINRNNEAGARRVPEGLWVKCPSCETVLYKEDLSGNLNVCPKCSHHMRIGARARIDSLLDADGRTEIGEGTRAVDPLKFKDSRRYPERVAEAMKQTGESEAMVVMSGAILSVPVVLACFEFAFMGGSMGSVVGERFSRAARHSAEHRIPLVSFSASGGARMQEALFSLLQMSKTAAALAVLGRMRIPYISVMTDPTTGGVSASLAMLGDVNIAEPRALIGFAGPRVIEQTVRQKLPEGFQRSEFLLDHGAIDMILDRRRMRDEIADLLAKLGNRPKPSVPGPSPVVKSE